MFPILLEDSSSDNQSSLSPITSAVQQLASSQEDELELTLYSKVGMGDGQQASNPWLQEFPDPISRVTWDNYVTVSRSDAANWGLINGKCSKRWFGW